MRVVFDMDNTLVDDNGRIVRPGMLELLKKLQDEGYTLVLWTSSPMYRTEMILKDNDLVKYFPECYYREAFREYSTKDIRLINADIIVDDDPEVVKYNLGLGKKAFLVKSFRNEDTVLDSQELIKVYAYIQKENNSIRNKLFSLFK